MKKLKRTKKEKQELATHKRLATFKLNKTRREKAAEEKKERDQIAAEKRKRTLAHKKVDQVFRKEFQDFSINGKGDVRALAAHKPKDWAFKTKNEGRPKLVTTKKVNVKLKKEIWQQPRLLTFMRGNQIHVGKDCNWMVMLENPDRKMQPNDQLEILLAFPDTFFTVKFNVNHRWLIVEDVGGTIL